ncbi:MAG: PadR family transcriptional regulator [Spirochaetaceae bacterium]|nr:PadR family transcriptional regulator [Spirochaetaceae bacterium]
MAKENRARYAVLGMLHYGDMTGYEIRKRLNEMVGCFWQEPSASVYPALKALEEDGFVTARRETPESGPARIRYRVTSAGRAAFGSWIVQDPAPTAMRNEFALKLLFGNLADPATMLRFIAAERAAALASDRGIEELTGRLPHGTEGLMWRLIADYGRSMAAATAGWCERAIKEIEAATAR